MFRRMAGQIARLICRYRGQHFADEIEKQCDAFHRALNNVDFNIERNGELRVLRMISNLQPKIIFDVGANKGDWTLLASKLSSSSVIHAFEIVPSTFDELSKSTKHLGKVRCVDHGLSNREEMITVSLGDDSSMATGCKIDGMQSHNNYYKHDIQCRVRKACDYMRENNIECIDFLKIDVEGMDFKVIEGFEDSIEKVRALQFEYGIFNISSHDLLADFCKYLDEKGFVVGKIFPRHVSFFQYHFHMENFHGSNYVAVRADETDLIETLKTYSA